MGDLGSDAAGSALSLSAKAVEAILRLTEQIFKTWRERPERKLAKFKLKNAKTELERQQILDSLNGKVGLVNYDMLKKSGLELQPLAVYMTKAELKEFAALCKREGILIAGMTDNTEKNADGVKTYQLVCKKCDVPAINRIVNRLNDEKRIAGIEERIAEIRAKGDSMTEQDKLDIALLQEEKAAIQRKYCEELNAEMSNSVIEQAVSGDSQQKLTLDEALNRLTGRHIDKDVVCIVADANDPSKYIKCHGYQDTYNGKEYIKTDYEIYHGTDLVLKTHDGRFDGRPEGFWNEQKAAIQEAGQFSGTFFKFYSVVEYQKWAETVRNQNTQELTSMVKEGEKDYPGIIKELEGQLDKDGAQMQNGVVVDKQTGEPLVLHDNMTEEQRAAVAEASVIGKQINNYQDLQRLDAELSIAKANVLTAEEGSPERSAAEAELAQVQDKYDAALKAEQQLITERKEINAVQAEQEVRNAPEKAQEVEYLPEDKAKIEKLEAEIAAQEKYNYDFGYAIEYSDDPKMQQKEYAELKVMEEKVDSMKAELKTMKEQATRNALDAQHPDNRRGDRVDEKDNRRMSMREVKGKIEEIRGEDAAKGNDVMDRQVHDLGAKAVKPKAGKGLEDR